MKVKQGGINNSHFGKHWYTNRNTGECKHFVTAPDESWVEGRNLFHGENVKIKFVTKQREFYRNCGTNIILKIGNMFQNLEKKITS